MFQPNLIQTDFCQRNEISPDSLIVPMTGKDLLLHEGALPRLSQMTAGQSFLKIGSIDGLACYGCFPEEVPASLTRHSGREILASASMEIREAFCRAREMLLWRKQHRYCGCCQAQLKPSGHDLAMICPECGAVYFPQIAPAVIVAVTRNDGGEILLAHNRRFQNNVYSLIAGFVEAGESAENAVHREILEETQVSVNHIVYLASQSWPFPNSLMLAYHAEYQDGTPCPDGEELSDCRWFSRDALPAIPEQGSIARAVLDRFITKTL